MVASKCYRNSLLQSTEIATVNKEMYIDILHLLRDAVGRKGSEKWRLKIWFPFHDNAPAHRSVLVNDFLAKTNVTTPEHSTHVAATGFYLFSRLKSALKGRQFCGATDIIRNATEELKRLSRKGFSRKVSSTFTVAVRSVYLHKETILNEM